MGRCKWDDSSRLSTTVVEAKAIRCPAGCALALVSVAVDDKFRDHDCARWAWQQHRHHRAAPQTARHNVHSRRILNDLDWASALVRVRPWHAHRVAQPHLIARQVFHVAAVAASIHHHLTHNGSLRERNRQPCVWLIELRQADVQVTNLFVLKDAVDTFLRSVQCVREDTAHGNGKTIEWRGSGGCARRRS